MGPEEIKFIRKVFGYTQKNLAFAINTHYTSICRWETGKSRPSGIYESVLKIYYDIAKELEGKPNQAHKAGDLMRGGIRSVTFHNLIKREEDNDETGNH